jgi:hypothetical protein
MDSTDRSSKVRALLEKVAEVATGQRSSALEETDPVALGMTNVRPNPNQPPKWTMEYEDEEGNHYILPYASQLSDSQAEVYLAALAFIPIASACGLMPVKPKQIIFGIVEVHFDVAFAAYKGDPDAVKAKLISGPQWEKDYERHRADIEAALAAHDAGG